MDKRSFGMAMRDTRTGRMVAERIVTFLEDMYTNEADGDHDWWTEQMDRLLNGDQSYQLTNLDISEYQLWALLGAAIDLIDYDTELYFSVDVTSIIGHYLWRLHVSE